MKKTKTNYVIGGIVIAANSLKEAAKNYADRHLAGANIITSEDRQMVCFKDKTFCSETNCHNKLCNLRFTPRHHFDAQSWWNKGKPRKDWEGAPVSMNKYRDTHICPGYEER